MSPSGESAGRSRRLARRESYPTRAIRRGLLVIVLAAGLLAVVLVALSSSTRAQPVQGVVRFTRSATPEFEPFIAGRRAAYGAFLRRHVTRMVAFSPHFDPDTRWYPYAWVYDDAYAIYPGSALAAKHPDWILRDSAGRRLYIPYACSGGRCPQYAGDISNPAFRQQWIAQARAKLAHGYRGLFVDDVNMQRQARAGDGFGRDVEPVSPASGRTIGYTEWRADMAAFMAEVRAALPRTEIVHNVVWWAGEPPGAADPAVAAEMRAADYLNLERGVTGAQLTGGGLFSMQRMLSYIDAAHGLGKGVILEGSASQPAALEYELAAYFLISTGRDFVSAEGMTPLHWWGGFEVKLGRALGPRKLSRGLLSRTYAKGLALVNEPGAETRVVALAAPMRRPGGPLVRSVTLPPASGVVLVRG